MELSLSVMRTATLTGRRVGACAKALDACAKASASEHGGSTECILGVGMHVQTHCHPGRQEPNLEVSGQAVSSR